MSAQTLQWSNGNLTIVALPDVGTVVIYSPTMAVHLTMDQLFKVLRQVREKRG